MKKKEIKSFLKKQIKLSCYAEMSALKPGNVHEYSPGHRMITKDFYKSANIIANCLTNNNFHFSKKILKCVQEIKEKVKKNTNLGIILLFAPIVSIVLEKGILNKKELYKKIPLYIKKQNLKKSLPIFEAIKIAAPGGLGKSTKYDVNQLPKVTLYNAMNYSSKKDFIAKQYITGFKDIFKIGLPAYENFQNNCKDEKWILTWVYLTFLKSLADSHIKRNKGIKVAKKVKIEAKKYYKLLKNEKKNNNMRKITKKLLFFDKKLKSAGINPGTTADLTVVTLFIKKVTEKQQKKL